MPDASLKRTQSCIQVCFHIHCHNLTYIICILSIFFRLYHSLSFFHIFPHLFASFHIFPLKNPRDPPLHRAWVPQVCPEAELQPPPYCAPAMSTAMLPGRSLDMKSSTSPVAPMPSFSKFLSFESFKLRAEFIEPNLLADPSIIPNPSLEFSIKSGFGQHPIP